MTRDIGNKHCHNNVTIHRQCCENIKNGGQSLGGRAFLQNAKSVDNIAIIPPLTGGLGPALRCRAALAPRVGVAAAKRLALSPKLLALSPKLSRLVLAKRLAFGPAKLSRLVLAKLLALRSKRLAFGPAKLLALSPKPLALSPKRGVWPCA